jgi:hypothetical protein
MNGERPLADRDFAALFTSFQRSAFRLETLSEYRVPQESEAFSSFLAGQPLPPAPDPEWTAWIAQSTAAGKILERVHVVPSRLTPYLGFEIAWGYAHSAHAGERIRLLVHDELANLFADLPYGDFWLFDDKVVVQMEYDRDGRFLSAKHVPSAEVASYLTCRDRAKTLAIPLEEYLALERRA